MMFKGLSSFVTKCRVRTWTSVMNAQRPDVCFQM